MSNKSNLTNLFDEKFEQRLFCIARSEWNQSSYGHGKEDGQSCEVTVASTIEEQGKYSGDEAYEIAVEIVSRVISQIDEENDIIERAANALP